MKKLTLLLALFASFAVLTPSTSQARDHRDSRRVAYHCRSCGDSVYQERYYAGRDRYGRPIFSWRTVSHRCRYSHRHGHGHGHGHHRGSGFGVHFSTGGR
ncbi:MAG: hypothetical protein U0984_17335 [Prosthecobacter sp.]|nr:hypothetical protein [Prosthecobacter sp.]